MAQQADPLNDVLLNARRQLQEIQRSLHETNVPYKQILSKLSETTSKLQEETDQIALSMEKATESTLIPLKTGRRRVRQKEEKPRVEVSPREKRPYKVTKAMQLRQQFIGRPKKQQNVPLLRPGDKAKPVSALMAEGKVTPYDDVSDVLKPIQGNVTNPYIPIYGSIHVDIKGAAESIRVRKERHRMEKEALRAQVQEYVSDDRASLASVEEVEPEPEETDKHPRIYEELQDEFAYQTLIIVRGKIARETPDFESFKRTNEKLWDKINDILRRIELFCQKYGIQFAEINGRKLGEAALLQIVTEDDIHACLVGVDDFVLKKQTEAALIIKRAWKRFWDQKQCQERKIQFRAAYKIQTFWRLQMAKRKLLGEIRRNLNSVTDRAAELSKSLHGQFSQIEKDPYVVVHVVVSLQDLSRVFDLMYKNVEMILLLPSLPAPHIWDDFLEVLAQNGVMDANSRIHFIMLKDGEGVSKRLTCDMKSVQQVRRLICGRPAFLVPHYDWAPESTLSVDIGLPIFGCVDTTYFQSRAAIKGVFKEAGIVSTISTKESTNMRILMDQALDLMTENSDLKRWIIRLGYTSGDSGIGWFELTNEFLNNDTDLELLFRKCLHCVGSVSSFLSHIKDVGATVEAVPQHIHSFPTVSLFLTGNEIRVVGTYDRLHHAPFRFSANLVPAVSVDSDRLIQMGRQVAAVLMKRGILGYVLVDFLAFKEDSEMHILGFDIRLNSYPSILNTAYMNLCCGYNENTNSMVMLQTVQYDCKKSKRYAVVHNSLTHPALCCIGVKDIRKAAYSQGLMFDLLNRTGFRMVFYGSPAEGKGFSIAGGISSELALAKMEQAYTYLCRWLAQKVGSDATSSIAQALISIRHFKARM